MRIDTVEFEDALSSGTMVPVMTLVEAGSVVRQSSYRVQFNPGDDGMTRHVVQGARSAICNNQLGGSSLVNVGGVGEIHLLPEAMSIAVTTETPAQMIASLMCMREEVLLKRILDGSNIENEGEMEWTPDHDEMIDRLDEDLTQILKMIGCQSSNYSPGCCPLILFDAPMLASDRAPMIRRMDESGHRLPDAMATVDDRRCRMYSFPGIVKPSARMSISIHGVDERTESMNLYVIEPRSIYMLTSDAMHATFPLKENTGIITWITGFSIPFNRRIHRIKVTKPEKE